jgi:AraC-like DNA-binding protein
MELPPNSPRPVVRSEWITETVRHFQITIGLLSSSDVRRAIESLETFTAALPRAESPAEWLVLRGMLLEFAYRFSVLASEQSPPPHRAASDTAGALLDRLVAQMSREPTAAFLEWARSFGAEWLRTHPPPFVEKAAAAIRSDLAAKWTASLLASRLGVPIRDLRRSFREQYGMSVHEYVETVRIIGSLELLGHEKVESVAGMVGYHSAKNFYRAFFHVVGLTPGQFRRLSPAHAAAVAATLEPARRS